MWQGYPFKGTGAVSPGTTATVYDPILRVAVTTITIRGTKRMVTVQGVSVASDAPGLGSNIRVKVGNSEPDYRYFDVPPSHDGDLATGPVHTANYHDMGGYEVHEMETISILIVDPGAAELVSGVLWVDDGEPYIPIPGGRIVVLKCGGTNDGGTSIAATGFDMDARKLENGNLYTVFKVITRPEDKVIEVALLAAGKEVMTLPPVGMMVYGNTPLQFTGAQYNAGQVVGYLQVQAATKAEFWIYLVEQMTRETTPSAPPIVVAPQHLPGAVTLLGVQQNIKPKPSIQQQAQTLRRR